MSLIPWLNKDKKQMTEMNEWFNKFWGDTFRSGNMLTDHLFSGAWPAVDVSEDDKSVTVKVEVPGLTEKELDVSHHNGVLTIKGEKKDEFEEKSKNTYYREASYGSFSRSIPLGEQLEWDKVSAACKNGNLIVTLPKQEGAENNVKIKVQV